MTSNTQNAPLAILTTVAMQGVLEELEAEFAREHGRRFAMTFGPGGVTAERVRAGTAADLVIFAPATLETLAAEGHLVGETIAPLARSVIGVAVRAGAPRPRIDSVENFKRALLDAKSIAYSDPSTGAASGVHFAKLMARLGITDAVNVKAKLGSGGPVAEFLVRGEAELAIQQICEHMLVKGIDVVGPIPDDLQSVTTLAAALHAKAEAPEASEALIRLLTSPRTQTRLPAHGLEPAA